MFNALQPGIFGVSGWDMVGALPIPNKGIESLVKRGDTRWHNRGAYDLLGKNNYIKKAPTAMKLPACKNIYGDIATQLKDKNSFCSQLKNIHLYPFIICKFKYVNKD